MKKGMIITCKVAKTIAIIILVLACGASLGLVGNIETSNAPVSEYTKPIIMLLVTIFLSVITWRGANVLIRRWQE